MRSLDIGRGAQSEDRQNLDGQLGPNRFQCLRERVIARLCRVELRRVWRAVDRQVRVQPAWFDQCLLMHDQPAPATAAERRRTVEEMWWEQYDDLAAHMRESDGALPRQNDSRRSHGLYHWVLKQR